MEQRLYDAAVKLPETDLDFQTIQQAPKLKPTSRILRTLASLAACLLLLISLGFVAVEAVEYGPAIIFFYQNGLSTDGLSLGEIKAVYEDITTKSFTYSKTAEVIAINLSVDQVGGYEILQDNPTPEDLEYLWDYIRARGRFLQQGIHYKSHTEYDDRDAIVKSYIEKYSGTTLLWTADVTHFEISGCDAVSDGIIVYGKSRSTTGHHDYAWMAKIDSDGNRLWERVLINGFWNETICEVVENPDGTYAVFSHGSDYRGYHQEALSKVIETPNGTRPVFRKDDTVYLCLSQFTADAELISFHKTVLGDYGIWKATRYKDGYVVQLGNKRNNEYSKIATVDRQGNITSSFSYGSEDSYYYITDMIEYNEKIYLSAYSVPKYPNDNGDMSGRNLEIAGLMDYVHDFFRSENRDISSEELTPLVRDNYTAILLVCDPTVGTPQEFYSVKGSFGGKLSLSESGLLQWDVKSITTAEYTPAINIAQIFGSCYVYRYTFRSSGKLISQEKTGEIVTYYR